MSITHIKSLTIADGTNTDIVRPSDWLSSHGIIYNISSNTSGSSRVSGLDIILVGGNNITLSADTANSKLIFSGANVGGAQTGISGLVVSNTTYTSGTITFQNANGISFGSSGANGVSASYTVPSTAGLISAINISGGITSNNLSVITFSNSNNVSFGLNGSTLTASASYSQSTSPGGINAGTQTATSGTIIFSNSNGISFGMSNSSVVTASYTVPATAGLISNINVSAGTTSNNLSALTFSNSNGMSFGLSGSTITGSYTVPSQTNQSAIKGFGASNTGNTAGNTGISTGIDWVIAGSNNITISESTAGGGPNTLWISGPTVGGAQTGISGVVVSNTTYTSGTITFQNANGISFGSSGANGISASYTVPAQTNQTVGVYASSQTVGQSSSSTIDARSFTHVGQGIISVGMSAGSLLISATTAAQTNQSAIRGLGASNTGNTAGNTGISTGIDWVIAGSNNITISESTAGGGPNTLWISGPTVGGAQTGISGVVVSNTTYTSGTITFQNANGISFGSSGANGISASYTVPTQTNQTLGFYNSSQTVGQSSSSTLDARSVTYVGQGIISVGMSAGSMLISATTAAQTVQSAIQALGISNTGNTAGNTGVSTGINWVIAGSNNITASQSTTAGGPNTIWISGPTVGGAQTGISALVVSNTTYTSGTVTFQNANGISFGSSGANGISASYTVPTQSNQTEGYYIAGNTTGQSSSSTMNATSINFSAAGIASVGISGGTVIISVPSGGGGITNINVSGGTTSNNLSALTFSNANGVSFGLNGSTLTASVSAANTLSYYENNVRGGVTTLGGGGQPQIGTLYVQPFVVSNPITMYRLNIMQSVTGLSASSNTGVSASISGGNGSSGTGSWFHSGTVLMFSRQSTGTNANSSNIISFVSQTYSMGAGATISLSWSTNASSCTASYTTTQALSFLSNIDSVGGTTTGVFSTSGSTTFSSTGAGAGTFATTVTFSQVSQGMSGIRPVMIPMATSLSAGEYWLGYIQSTNNASNYTRMDRVVNYGQPGMIYFSSNTQGYAEVGNTASIASSNMQQGWGSYGTTANTTTTFPLSNISNMSQYGLYFNMTAATK